MQITKGTTNHPLTDAQIQGICTAISTGTGAKFSGDAFQMSDDDICKTIGITMHLSMPGSKRERDKLIRKISDNCSEASHGIPSLSVRAMVDVDIPEIAILRLIAYKPLP